MRAAIEETTAGLRSAVGGLLRDYDVKWAFHTREGDPGSVLAELAEDTDAYCIVVGTRGEGVAATLNRLIRPSVSHALIQHCPRPVLVVSVNNAPADDV
jgi:nucleotide-binding universal stress UspA family protein